MPLINTAPGFQICGHLSLFVLDNLLQGFPDYQFLLVFHIGDVFSSGINFRFDRVFDGGFVMEAVVNALGEEGGRKVLGQQELEREGVLAGWDLVCESENWDF